MRLSWLDPEKPDPREVALVAGVKEAARVADCPHRPQRTVANLRNHLRYGWEGDPAHLAAAYDGDTMVAFVELGLPHRDNTHKCDVDIVVDPLLRRRGYGTRLLDLVVERAHAEGRRLLQVNPWDRSPGPQFLDARGFTKAYEETQRAQDVAGADRAKLEAERRAAAQVAGDYDIERYEGATPDELMADLVVLSSAINDAPTDTLDVEDEVFDADRVRTFEQVQLRERRLHRLVARHRATGEPAGQTMVAVYAEFPWTAEQYDTSVVRAHRGHRLGLLLKLEMLRHLAVAEPQLRTITTWNADSNAHMLRVNELLDYRPVAVGSAWQRQL